MKGGQPKAHKRTCHTKACRRRYRWIQRSIDILRLTENWKIHSIHVKALGEVEEREVQGNLSEKKIYGIHANDDTHGHPPNGMHSQSSSKFLRGRNAFAAPLPSGCCLLSFSVLSSRLLTFLPPSLHWKDKEAAGFSYLSSTHSLKRHSISSPPCCRLFIDVVFSPPSSTTKKHEQAHESRQCC
mmetsp:Transcript_12982/g.25391  ORF Transcript_12982/g.25391 Transcript_12982/m.25391 type:complete len:184 (+) Transcript_12982:141-692(+)